MMLQVGAAGAGGGAWVPPGKAAGGKPGRAEGLGNEEVGSHSRPRFLGLLGVGAPWEPVTDAGSCVGMGCRAHPLAPGVGGDVDPGCRSVWLGKLGSACSGALAPRARESGGAVLPAPARDGGCIATGSVPCTRSPGWTQGGGGRGAPAALGAAKSWPPRTRGAGARGQSGAGKVILAPTLRSGPAQMAGSQTGVPRAHRAEGDLQAAVPGSLSALQGLGSGASGGGAWTERCSAGQEGIRPAALSEPKPSPVARSGASLLVRGVTS